MIERCEVLEPIHFLSESQIFADTYIKIEDRILYEVAVKLRSIDDALAHIEFYGDEEIWRYQLDALRKILPSEHFEVKREKKKVEENIACISTKDEDETPHEFKFLTDALIKLNET